MYKYTERERERERESEREREGEHDFYRLSHVENTSVDYLRGYSI